MKYLVTKCLLVLVCCTSAFAQTSSSATSGSQAPSAPSEDRAAKRAEIRILIELTGAANISADALRKIIDPLRAGFPQVPAEFWNTFIKEVHSDELIDLVVPIYDKYYTRDEIQDLTRFYQSPVGQKTIKVLPKLSAEAIDAGQEWGKMVADRAMRKLREQGYDKSSSIQPGQRPAGR